MDENELRKQEYIFAKEMIFSLRNIVWILFGFFVTINLGFYSFIVKAIYENVNILDKSQDLKLISLLLSSGIITIVNASILRIWLREHTQQRENIEQINWIRQNLYNVDKKSWLFFNPRWQDSKKCDIPKNPEKNKTFEAIRFLLIFFTFLSTFLVLLSLASLMLSNKWELLTFKHLIQFLSPFLGCFATIYSLIQIYQSYSRKKQHSEYINEIRKYNE